MPKRKNNPDQPELPIEGVPAQKPGADIKAKKDGDENKPKPSKNGHTNGVANGNGETHVLAENVAAAPVRPFKPGKIEF